MTFISDLVQIQLSSCYLQLLNLFDVTEDLEWKIIYVGSAESEEFDQILDTVYVGPVPEGRHKFVFSADPPNPHKVRKTKPYSLS